MFSLRLFKLDSRPALLFLVIITAIAAVELAVMGFIDQLRGWTHFQKALLDTLMLSVTVTPILYALFLRPLRKNLKSLQQSHEKIIRQQEAIDKSQDLGRAGMWEIDFLNGTISGSEQACRIMGLPPGTPFNFEHVLKAVHPEDRRAVKFAWNRMMIGKPYDLEKRFLIDGQIKWFRSKVEMTFDEEGDPLKAVGFIQDITEFKMMQAKAIRAGQLVSAGETAAMVAHEVNNPLSGIVGFVEILSRKAVAGSREEAMLKRILSETDRISNIVNGMLKISYDSGITMDYRNITPIIVDTLQFMAPQIEKKGIVLEYELAEELPQIHCNTQQIEQIILNIVRNAYQALLDGTVDGGDHRYIRIRTAYIELNNRPHVRLAIINNGPNIPGEILDKIRQPFFTTKSIGVGTGLGLSISNDIMDNHNGLLDIRSDAGAPTEMNLYFPIDDDYETEGRNADVARGATLQFEEVPVRKKKRLHLTKLKSIPTDPDRDDMPKKH